MNVLVYEYFSGGGAERTFNAGNLDNLGWAMLHACIEDCLAADHQVCTLVDRRLQGNLPAACAVQSVSPGQSLSAFKDMMSEVDAVLPIAPETNGILSNLTSLVEQSGRLLLGSTTQATRIAGDKFASYLTLMSHGCKLPETALWPVPLEKLPAPGPWILKPRSGAGCEGIYLTASPDTFDIPNGEYIIQEYVPGVAASVAMIAGKSCNTILSVNLQKMVFDPAPHYKGGAIPLVHSMSKAARSCAGIVARAIPGLRGYVGIDMVLTPCEVYVIEVNPRITFTYCGLRRITSQNLMKAIIEVSLGFDIQDEISVTGSVQFDDLGRIREGPDA